MTCIVGVQGDDFVVIGGDSASVSGWTVERRHDAKVFRVGEFVYGSSGSWRLDGLLRYSFKPPAQDAPGDHRYMVTDWVDALRECVKGAGLGKTKDEVESIGDSSILVAYRNRLYEISSDYQVGQPVRYGAVGCGATVALGALYVLSMSGAGLDAATVIAALQASEAHNCGVRAPFVVIDTRVVLDE